MFQFPEIPTGCGVLVGAGVVVVGVVVVVVGVVVVGVVVVGVVVVGGVVVGVVVVVVVRVGRLLLCTEVWVSAFTAVALDAALEAAFVPAWFICLW
jgi:hypothetical protein